jgi:hypothetical protein
MTITLRFCDKPNVYGLHWHHLGLSHVSLRLVVFLSLRYFTLPHLAVLRVHTIFGVAAYLRLTVACDKKSIAAAQHSSRLVRATVLNCITSAVLKLPGASAVTEPPTQEDAAHELDVCSDDADESSIASLLFPDWTTVLSVFERIVVTG